jgi:hypothetical protein
MLNELGVAQPDRSVGGGQPGAPPGVADGQSEHGLYFRSDCPWIERFESGGDDCGQQHVSVEESSRLGEAEWSREIEPGGHCFSSTMISR